MKVVRIHQFGGPEVLTYEDIPDPQPRKDRVLVRVKACSLNHLDVWVRKGLPGVKLPHILGSDIAGEIVEVPAATIIPIPDSLDFNQAASVPLVFVTAWHMLVGLACVRPGQTVLVLGASSGVGIAAIQIAKLFHCRVITTAGDESKLEKARALGADHGINHYQQKISDEVRKITNKAGVDVVIEHVGAATWDESVKSLKTAGVLVTCGATTGPNVSIDLRHLFARQLTLLGSYMGTMGELHEVLGHVYAGRLKPVVDRVFPLSEIRAAHEYLEKSQMFGKVVLSV